ncbi:conserved hypothetical protein [Verrucomicrobia bacterium]|nr:conserved hypothetical protein [Verrucomicrobiota bacterium]
MGQPKLLLPWGETTVLGHLLSQWQRLGAQQIAVVCAADDTGLLPELDRLGFPAVGRIFNPAAERGMFSSIQCAARWPEWDASLTHWAIVLGDQPHLRPNTLEAVLKLCAVQPSSVCQPSRAGRGRHPVVLPKAVFQRLAAAVASTFKEFLESLPTPVARAEQDDPGLDLDIDRFEDYEQALRLARVVR